MAEVLPVNFPIPGESAIASYNQEDIADGTGRATFYLTASADSAGTYYELYPSTDKSRNITTQIDGGTINFDASPFNTPRRVRGNFYLVYPADKVTGAGTLTFQLKKSSGGVITNIGASTVSQNITGEAVFFTKIAVSTIVSFKKGDFLRLEVIGTNPAGNLWLGTDPANRTDAYFLVSSQSKLIVPFLIDL